MAGEPVRRQGTGTEVFIIANADTVVSRPNATLVKEFYPDVEVRGDLGEHDTLLSIEKARRLLGYRPAYGWRNGGTYQPFAASSTPDPAEAGVRRVGGRSHRFASVSPEGPATGQTAQVEAEPGQASTRTARSWYLYSSRTRGTLR
jgi:hypothetical protein